MPGNCRGSNRRRTPLYGIGGSWWVCHTSQRGQADQTVGSGRKVRRSGFIARGPKTFPISRASWWFVDGSQAWVAGGWLTDEFRI
jgi:hypothetical protein